MSTPPKSKGVAPPPIPAGVVPVPPPSPTQASPSPAPPPQKPAAPVPPPSPPPEEEDEGGSPGAGSGVELSDDGSEAENADEVVIDDTDERGSTRAQGPTPTAAAGPDPKAATRPLRTAHWELHPVNPPTTIFVARRLSAEESAKNPPPAATPLAAVPGLPPGASRSAASSPGPSLRASMPDSPGAAGASSTLLPPRPSAPPTPADGGHSEDEVPDAAAPPPSVGSSADAMVVLKQVQSNIGNVVIGYEGVVRALLVALAAQGHILLEGVPGLAKTYLVRAFARSLALSFRRIQFTPDMLPADILGTVVLVPQTQQFEFRPGPIFAHVILADEINRAPPKVQSALLEAMQERQVTIEGVSHPLPSPFVVIATENPVELEGTYPLPEAELDRFLFRIILGYPSAENELRLLKQRTRTNDPTMSEGVLLGHIVENLRAQSQAVFVNDDLLRYIAAILRESRNDPRVLSGASPRAGVQLLMAVKAAALFCGRDYAIPDDVKDLVFDVLNHRLILRPEVIAGGPVASGGKDDGTRTLQDVVFAIANRVAVPW